MEREHKRRYGDSGREDRGDEARAPGRTTEVERLQRRADGNGVHEGADEAVARAGGSSGTALPETVQRKFESSLGADLSGVRVHTGGESAAAAQSVGARAYTVGQDIHFAAGQYDPQSSAGQHLLAHEVAHTVQQSGGASRAQFKLEVSSPGDAHEHEADRAADAMVHGLRFTVGSGAGLARRIDRFQDQSQPFVMPKDFDYSNADASGIEKQMALHRERMNQMSPAQLAEYKQSGSYAMIEHYWSPPKDIKPINWNDTPSFMGASIEPGWSGAPSYRPRIANNYLRIGMMDFGHVWVQTAGIWNSVAPVINEYRKESLAVGGIPGEETVNPVSKQTIGEAFDVGTRHVVAAYDTKNLKPAERQLLEAGKRNVANALSQVKIAGEGVHIAGNVVKQKALASANAVLAVQIPALQNKENEKQIDILKVNTEKGLVAGVMSGITKYFSGVASMAQGVMSGPAGAGDVVKGAQGVFDGVMTGVTTGLNYSYDCDIIALNQDIMSIRSSINSINEQMGDRNAKIVEIDCDSAQAALRQANETYNIARNLYQTECDKYSMLVGEAAQKMGMEGPDTAQLQNGVESVPRILTLKSKCDELANRCAPPPTGEMAQYGLAVADNRGEFLDHIARLKGAQEEFKRDSQRWQTRLSLVGPLL